MNSIYQPRRQVARNFHEWLGASSAVVVPVTVADLVSMLDQVHPEGAHFAIVSKATTRGTNVTTALDVPARRFYCAKSETGLVSLWRGVAKRRPAVQLLEKGEAFSVG